MFCWSVDVETEVVDVVVIANIIFIVVFIIIRVIIEECFIMKEITRREAVRGGRGGRSGLHEGQKVIIEKGGVERRRVGERRSGVVRGGSGERRSGVVKNWCVVVADIMRCFVVVFNTNVAGI